MRAVLVLPAALALMLAWPLSVLARPQGPEEEDTARIAGRVVTPSAELLSEAMVTLSGATGPKRSVTSTVTGAFAFDGVAPGSYVLAASKPGYTDRLVGPAGLLPPRTIAVGDGAQAADADLVLRRVGSIAGRIVRPDGTPAPGVQVLPALRSASGPVPLTELRTTSEWDGRYELTSLPPGEFLVMVQPAADESATSASLPVDVSRAPLQFEPTLYPGVSRTGVAGAVVVYEGTATEGIDVWLLPAPQRFTVSGRVFWPEGLEVENIAIEYGGSPDVRSGVWYVEDPGGLFTLEGISQGGLTLLARADSNRGPLVGIAVTDVRLGPVEEIRLDLSPPGSVSGRFVSDRPLPDGGSPRVSLRHTLLTVSPLFPTEDAVAAPGGAFHIPHARGTYRLEADGLPDGWRVQRVTRNGVELPGGQLLVGASERITGLDIHVGPAP